MFPFVPVVFVLNFFSVTVFYIVGTNCYSSAEYKREVVAEGNLLDGVYFKLIVIS